MEFVEESTLDQDEVTGRYSWKGVVFTGIAYVEGRFGRVETEIVDGWETGTSRAWYPGGALKCETTLWMGAPHGLRREWSPDGRLSAMELFELGVAVRRRRWDESSRVVEDYFCSDSQAEALASLRQRQPGAPAVSRGWPEGDG